MAVDALSSLGVEVEVDRARTSPGDRVVDAVQFAAQTVVVKCSVAGSA